jgi:hypothetical protein
MSVFAKIENDKVVDLVRVADEDSNKNPNFLTEELGLNGVWVLSLGDESKQKNAAQIFGTYDSEKDIFIPPQPFSKWILNTKNYQWEAPIPYPTDGLIYVWNNNRTEWEEQQ